jgi:serine/threonine-protein kinase
MSGALSDTVKAAEPIAVPEGVPGPGEIVAGKYRVEEVLGVGGMGVVLAVRHTTLNELYAMKFLLPQGAKEPDAAARFMREAKAAVRIKSEHIARVNDFGELENGSPYIVMEHLEGIDLRALTKRDGAQSPMIAADYVIQACAGLAEAHQLGIVHRDLKPSNLFLTRRADNTPLVKVLDFGISKAATDSALPTITATHESFGSPAYMSPEQIRSTKNVDVRSDVFSLGVILFELLTGRLPFEGSTSSALLAAIAADEPLTLREVMPDADVELEAVVTRCLQKKPADRFPTVSALAFALAPFAGTESQSLVQRIGRIESASKIPPPLEADPSRRAAVSGKPSGNPLDYATTAATSATERSWSTPAKGQAGPPAKRSPRALVIAALAAVGLGAIAFVAVGLRGAAKDDAGKTMANTATPPSAQPAAIDSSVVGIRAGTAAPASTAVASAGVTAGPAASVLVDGARAKTRSNAPRVGRPAASASSSASSAAPTSAVPSTAKPAPSVDPAAESH